MAAKDVYNKEIDSLSVRALNVLLKLEILDYERFINFMIAHNYSYDFMRVRNCGQHTADELNYVVKVLREWTKGSNINSYGLFSEIESPTLIVVEDKPSRIVELYKRYWLNFSFDSLTPGEMKYFKDEFNFRFEHLSERSRNVLKSVKISDIKAMVNFLQQTEYGYKFSSIKNCGKKAEKEIVAFVTDILSLTRSESKIEKTELELTLFAILKEVIFESKKFNEREVEILKLRLGIENLAIDSSKNSLQEIADKFNLSRERIRQLQSTLPRKISSLTNRIVREFSVDLSNYASGDYFLIDSNYTAKVNDDEQTQFSISFVIQVLSSISNLDYIVHKFNAENKLLGLATLKSIKFDFSKCFGYLTAILNKDVRKTDTKIDLHDLIKKHSKSDNSTNVEVVKQIIIKFISHYQHVEIRNDHIIIYRNISLKVYEHIRTLLNEYRKPLHFTQIYDLLKDRGVEVSKAGNVHSLLLRYADIFGLKGQGIYGLKEWGGCFGSIGDVAEQFIKLKMEPVSMRELEKYLCHELIISQESIKGVLFHYSSEDRFVKYRNGKIGLKEWVNGQISKTR